MITLNSKIIYKIYNKTFKNSTHIYTANNSKDHDLLVQVNNNRQAIMNDLGVGKIIFLNHVHGTEIIDVDILVNMIEIIEGDAAVTTYDGVALTIQTADCVPVLLASDNGNVIGVAHCGWRGTQNNILSKVVQYMRNKGAESITVVMGPAIHQHAYKVKKDFYDQILESSEFDAKPLFINLRNDDYLFDLPAFVLKKLHLLGIKNIINKCEDTFSHPDKYPSYRRDFILGLPRSDILSTIYIQLQR